MAKKKITLDITGKKVPAKRIEVFADKTVRKKNSFNWHVNKGDNVLYSAHGYDTRQNALKQAQAHKRTLKIELPIYLTYTDKDINGIKHKYALAQ